MSELSVGQLSGLTVNSNVITVPSGHTLYAPGHVLQVVSTAKRDPFSTSSTGYVDVTGLTVSITPKFASSKIFIQCFFTGNLYNQEAYYRIAGGNATSFVGDAAGSRFRAAAMQTEVANTRASSITITYLDSPNTTSAITYSLQTCLAAGGGVSYINRTYTDGDNANNSRTPSSITVMEIAQ
jgi:hypothetical protein